MFVNRRNKALVNIELAVDPCLLYLLEDSVDPEVDWKRLSNQFQKKTLAHKLSLSNWQLNHERLEDGGALKQHFKAITGIFNEFAVIGAAMEDEEEKVATL